MRKPLGSALLSGKKGTKVGSKEGNNASARSLQERKPLPNVAIFSLFDFG
jgi:hypothetical protein